jgi:hypothetical protein
MLPQKYQPPRVIAVDVDGTLFSGCTPNPKVIAWCRAQKAAGFTLFLWSSQGEAHCHEAIERSQTHDIFTHVLSKPGYILDDLGWSWIKYTRAIKSLADSPPTETAVPSH